MSPLHKLALAYVKAIKHLRLSIIYILSKLLFNKNETPQRILINRDGAFGDSVVALPALSIIRQNYPDAQIDLLSVNENGVSFDDLNLEESLINNLYVIKKNQRHETLKTLKKNHYDLFIQIPQNIGLYKSIRNILLICFYLNIKAGFGWDGGRIKSFMRLQKKYNEIPTEMARFIDSLKKNGPQGNINYPIKGVPLKNDALNNIIASPNVIAFLIGGKLQPKKWPLDHWVSLANMIGDQYKIVIIGGENEKNEAKHIVSNTSNPISQCGELTIPELYYLLKKICLAISLDTGAMHLCDAAKTKLITFCP